MSAPIIAFRQRAGGHGAVRRPPLFLSSNVVLAHFNIDIFHATLDDFKKF
jgi:hypothetical protein